MITLTIDGELVTVAEGTTIMEAAQRVNAIYGAIKSGAGKEIESDSPFDMSLVDFLNVENPMMELPSEHTYISIYTLYGDFHFFSDKPLGDNGRVNTTINTPLNLSKLVTELIVNRGGILIEEAPYLEILLDRVYGAYPKPTEVEAVHFYDI